MKTPEQRKQELRSILGDTTPECYKFKQLTLKEIKQRSEDKNWFHIVRLNHWDGISRRPVETWKQRKGRLRRERGKRKINLRKLRKKEYQIYKSQKLNKKIAMQKRLLDDQYKQAVERDDS